MEIQVFKLMPKVVWLPLQHTWGLIGGTEILWMKIYQKEKLWNRNSKLHAVLRIFCDFGKDSLAWKGLTWVQGPHFVQPYWQIQLRSMDAHIWSARRQCSYPKSKLSMMNQCAFPRIQVLWKSLSHVYHAGDHFSFSLWNFSQLLRLANA